ncbi:MAG: hypothetical protein ACRCSG_05635 [Cellulosilyticaceae bacterium]
MSHGVYFIEKVQVVHTDHYYLEFIYGIPGTCYHDLMTLTIPVPEEELDLAFFILDQYTEKINAQNTL